MGVKDGSGASIPLYEDLRKKLLKDYSRLTYYAPFPSEREICESYGVSRPTVRTALDLMEQDGDIVRLPRKGTFFLGNQPFTDHQLSSAGGFFNDVRLQGRETTSRVLFQNIDHAGEQAAEMLRIAPGDPVFHLERLRYLDGVLFSLANSFLPIRYLEYLKAVDFTRCSLYDVLSSHGVVPYKGLQQLRIRPADEYEAFHLEVEPGTPLSVLSSRMYTRSGELIEFVTTKSQAYMTSYEMVVYHDE